MPSYDRHLGRRTVLRAVAATPLVALASSGLAHASTASPPGTVARAADREAPSCLADLVHGGA
ncbi:hypothetical protein VV01_02100 [Luteipulveratus halotolerans]|uniref:Uncharacterized protein n=2 Tax=Luteipulveratus halotolerans TaxID=1631356 RepID=A0A0L6CFA8_9MICO|nr:hypothetical protein VV01_02100 [Luteipulveratus halotolerans]